MCDVTSVGENVYDEKDEEISIGQREMRFRPRRRKDQGHQLTLMSLHQLTLMSLLTP
jgi:hypothetical protein